MKTKFHTNDNTKVVKAKVIPEFEKTILGEISSRCRHTTAALLGLFCTQLGIRVSETFNAEAHCIDPDKFDEKYGMGLAQQKAVYKYHKAMKRKYQLLIDMLENAVDDLGKLELEHQNKCRKIEEDYAKYYLGKKE